MTAGTGSGTPAQNEPVREEGPVRDSLCRTARAKMKLEGKLQKKWEPTFTSYRSARFRRPTGRMSIELHGAVGVTINNRIGWTAFLPEGV